MVIRHSIPSTAGARRALGYMREFLDCYGDGISLVTIRHDLEPGYVGGYYGVAGYCHYPNTPRGVTSYRLRLDVVGPFPTRIHIARHPVYARLGQEPVPDHGCSLTGARHVMRRGEPWVRYEQYGMITLHTLNEGLVWILGHEWHHYATHSRRLRKRNTEINADEYGVVMLQAFRAERRSCHTF